MAEIAPFRGILYDTHRVGASSVLAPPYDVIDERGQKELAARDPHNSVRLILPEGEGDEKYTRAAETLETWLAEGFLRRDERPAIYRYHQIFSHPELGDRQVTRRGFISAVRLHDFSERIILPHERTLRGPKVDRLKLMLACRAHLSQIFTLYSDPSGETDRLLSSIEQTAPDIDGTTDDGTRHVLWRVIDREVIGRIAKLLAPLKLYIADGHHRYETMLAMREHDREQAGGTLEARSAAEFGTMFLANMHDPGLVVLPTHRLIHGVAAFSAAALLERAAEHFEVTILEGGAENSDALRRVLAREGAKRPCMAAVFPDSPDASLLALKPDFDPQAAGLGASPVLARLDVTLLHELVLERILGIDRAAQEAKTNIDYVDDTDEALTLIAAGVADVGFILNATSAKQVKDVSDAGEIMPQKSTFFYPKIASGLVINRIDPNETLD